MTSSDAPGRTRWSMIAMLVGFSLVSYIERMNISVAAAFMMPELGLTQIQMGQVFSAFVLGYASLQIPVGMLADRVGPYRVLATLGWLWAALTLLTGWLPGTVGVGSSALATLIAVRFVLGISVAGVYPLCARTTANWMPSAERAFAYSLVIAGVSIGSSVTPPAVAWLMATLGWRASFYLSAVPAVIIALVWMRYGADRPATSTRITPAERAYIERGQPPGASTPATPRAWLAILRTPSMLLLALSYFCIGYVLYVFVFWFFTYLVEVRRFSLVGSGFVTSLPFVAAAVLSPIGGRVCDMLTARYGRRVGRRTTALIGILLAASCLAIGIRTESVALAVTTLSLAFGFQMFSESAYWSATMDIAGRATGAATGLINTLNNLGGVVSTALTPVLIARYGWTTAFNVCLVASLVAALLWVFIKADRPLAGSDAQEAVA